MKRFISVITIAIILSLVGVSRGIYGIQIRQIIIQIK